MYLRARSYSWTWYLHHAVLRGDVLEGLEVDGAQVLDVDGAAQLVGLVVPLGVDGQEGVPLLWGGGGRGVIHSEHASGCAPHIFDLFLPTSEFATYVKVEVI